MNFLKRVKEKLKKAGGFITDKFWEGIVFLIGIFLLSVYKISGGNDQD
jgi:hypothetical protein